METNNNHEHVQHTHEHQPKKSFFEKYQLFFAIIIIAILAIAAFLIVHFVPNKNSDSSGTTQAEQVPTQAQTRKLLIGVAKDIGLNTKQFAACLDNHTETQTIANDVALAQKSGVQGTPTFFIVERTFKSDGSVATQKQFEILGARDETTFLQAIAAGKSPADQPAQPAGAPIVLSSTDHLIGPANAAVTIVEYADIDCPFCKAEKPIIDNIMQTHPEYALVFRNSPIVQLHPWAEYKAEGDECATMLGGNTAFWKYLNATMKS